MFGIKICYFDIKSHLFLKKKVKLWSCTTFFHTSSIEKVDLKF